MLLRLSISLVFTFVFAAQAIACSCVGIENKSIGEHIGSDAVFVGKPVMSRYAPTDNQWGNYVVTTFEVDRKFRGAIGETVEIRHRQDGAACGVWFTLGERQLVNAYESEAGLATGSCSNRLPDILVINYFEKHEDYQLMSRWECEEAGWIEDEPSSDMNDNSSLARACSLYHDDARTDNWKAWRSWLEKQNFNP